MLVLACSLLLTAVPMRIDTNSFRQVLRDATPSVRRCALPNGRYVVQLEIDRTGKAIAVDVSAPVGLTVAQESCVEGVFTRPRYPAGVPDVVRRSYSPFRATTSPRSIRLRWPFWVTPAR